MIIILDSGYLFSTHLNILIESLINVSELKSFLFSSTLDNPCPLKSNATTVANFFTSLAKQAKLNAECPAPWRHKNTGH